MVGDKDTEQPRKITAEMRAKLRSEMKRTGVGEVNFCKRFPKTPSVTTRYILQSVLYERITNAVPLEDWDWVIKMYEQLPDNPREPITEELRQHIRSEIERTGKGPALFSKTQTFMPTDALKRLVSKIVCIGTTRTILTSNREMIIEAYAALPDLPPSAEMPEPDNQERQVLESVMAELQRSGLSLRKLGQHIARDARGNVPSGLVSVLLAGEPPQVGVHDTEVLLPILRALPDRNKTPERIALTKSMIGELEAELRRTRISNVDIVKRVGLPRKANLGTWRSGQIKTVQKAHWNAVMQYLRSMPIPR